MPRPSPALPTPSASARTLVVRASLDKLGCLIMAGIGLHTLLRRLAHLFPNERPRNGNRPPGKLIQPA